MVLSLRPIPSPSTLHRTQLLLENPQGIVELQLDRPCLSRSAPFHIHEVAHSYCSRQLSLADE